MEATKEAYLANMGQTVKIGRYTCEVCSRHKATQSGSYERGFKFGGSTYGYLKTHTKARGTEYSFDHGATWSRDVFLASKVRSGKILLARDKPRGEFAFDAIQKINRDYDSNYQWRP